MPTERHRATCICTDCLPGGKREHRVRPWTVKAENCDHHDYEKADGLSQAKSRLRVPLIGGDVLEICRLCGALVGIEDPTPQGDAHA